MEPPTQTRLPLGLTGRQQPQKIQHHEALGDFQSGSYARNISTMPSSDTEVCNTQISIMYNSTLSIYYNCLFN